MSSPTSSCRSSSANAPASAPGGDDALARRLATFLAFERAVRGAGTREALGFVVCNEIGRTLRTDTVLLLDGGTRPRVRSVSGVSDFEPDAPLVAFAESVVASVVASVPDASSDSTAVAHTTESLDAGHAATLRALGLDALLAVPLGGAAGTLVALRRGDGFGEAEVRIATEAGGAIGHAWHALGVRHRGGGNAVRAARTPTTRRGLRAGLVLGCVALGFLPVRQSVMAEAEIVAARPEAVVAGIDGIVRELLVAPNERVRAGQPLLRLDDVELGQERARLDAELALARDRLREARQSALGRSTGGGALLAELEAAIDLKALELDAVDERLSRLELRASRDGVALYSREQDWLGRAVRTGDRIMEIAVDGEPRFEAWVAVADAIELESGDALRFFPDAFPLDAMSATVDSMSFFARRTPEDTLAYRVIADPSDEAGATLPTTARLGMKGSARVYGDRVALGYYLLRRPLAAARRFVGV